MEEQIPTQERISKGYGRLMIGIGILFDLLPIIILAVVFVTGIYFISSYGLVDIAQNADRCMNDADTFWGRFWQNNPVSGAVRQWYCAKVAGAVVTTGLGAILATAFGVFFILPMIYTITSYISIFLAYLTFTFWFMFRGVYIWSPSKPKKILVTVSTALLETVPILNLLPGITLMVWRHVKYTQMEDALQNKETAQKVASMLQRALPAQ